MIKRGFVGMHVGSALLPDDVLTPAPPSHVRGPQNAVTAVIRHGCVMSGYTFNSEGCKACAQGLASQ